MNKFLKLGLILSVLLSFTTYSNAIGFKMGVSATGAFFSADGKEVADSDTQTDSGDLYIGYASIFGELGLGIFSVGVSYVPYAMESETTDNARQDDCGMTSSGTCTTSTNTVQVDIVDLTTIYGKVNVGDNLYGKVGVARADVETNEKLGNSTYGNTDLTGAFVAAGFEKDLEQGDGMFIRGEASYSVFDDVSLTASNTENIVTVTDLSGASLSISIGKSF